MPVVEGRPLVKENIIRKSSSRVIVNVFDDGKVAPADALYKGQLYQLETQSCTEKPIFRHCGVDPSHTTDVEHCLHAMCSCGQY